MDYKKRIKLEISNSTREITGKVNANENWKHLSEESWGETLKVRQETDKGAMRERDARAYARTHARTQTSKACILLNNTKTRRAKYIYRFIVVVYCASRTCINAYIFVNVYVISGVQDLWWRSLLYCSPFLPLSLSPLSFSLICQVKYQWERRRKVGCHRYFENPGRGKFQNLSRVSWPLLRGYEDLGLMG